MGFSGVWRTGKHGEITIIDEYWLLNISSKDDVPTSIRAKLALISVSGRKNEVISPGNQVNSPGNPQSKGKESRVKESIGVGDAPPAGHTLSSKEFVPPTVEEVAAYVRAIGSRVEAWER